MQVFLPEYTFEKSAKVLDYKRLVKQLLEGRQIMSVLAQESPGRAWRNHPAVRMFEGHEHDLYDYLTAIRDEMDVRGYKWQNNWAVIEDTFARNFAEEDYVPAEWIEDPTVFDRVIITHRGRLWQKDPMHYASYEEEGNTFMDYVCCPDKGCTYFWATHNYEVVS